MPTFAALFMASLSASKFWFHDPSGLSPARGQGMFPGVMKTFFLLSFSLALLATTALAGQDIPVSALPQAVKNSLASNFPKGRAFEAEIKRRNDRPYYEVKLRHRDVVIEVEVSPRGEILDVDRD